VTQVEPIYLKIIIKLGFNEVSGLITWRARQPHVLLK
jgi:hypothetical protein